MRMFAQSDADDAATLSCVSDLEFCDLDDDLGTTELAQTLRSRARCRQTLIACMHESG